MMQPSDDVCTELDVWDLNEDGDALGRSFRVSGRTGMEDAHQGTCSSDSRLGSSHRSISRPKRRELGHPNAGHRPRSLTP